MEFFKNSIVLAESYLKVHSVNKQNKIIDLTRKIGYKKAVEFF